MDHGFASLVCARPRLSPAAAARSVSEPAQIYLCVQYITDIGRCQPTLQGGGCIPNYIVADRRACSILIRNCSHSLSFFCLHSQSQCQEQKKARETQVNFSSDSSPRRASECKDGIRRGRPVSLPAPLGRQSLAARPRPPLAAPSIRIVVDGQGRPPPAALSDALRLRRPKGDVYPDTYQDPGRYR